MSINKNLFDALPIGFFNCLASGSSNRIYSDCLLLIARSRIRDALAIYLLENHIDYLDDEMTTDRNYNQLANSVIRKFCSKEVGWLEEDTDDATYEKHIMMTEQGVFLAEFLQKMRKRLTQKPFRTKVRPKIPRIKTASEYCERRSPS